ncbi:MAG: glycosyltransferase family 4 protein [Polyangiaceae bacterium]
MKIVWLCHYFAPEIGAPQARLLELSRAFRKEGHDVSVVTCFPNHPTGEIRPEDKGLRHRRDQVDGVAVERRWSYVTPNKGFIKKTLGHLSFMATGWGGLASVARDAKPDVVIVSSPTFFSVFTAWTWCRLHGVPWVFEVRDLWPGVFVELGVLKNPIVIKALEQTELFLYGQATRVVPVTRSFKTNIADRGIDPSKIEVVTNGVDLERFTPGPPDPTFVREEGIEGRFVVLYLGAHGISHALARILDAAERLRDVPDVLFVFVGEGAEKEQLIAETKRRGLENVSFRAAVPKDRVLSWYRAASVGLVPLRNVPLFKTFIPSKMFELLACRLPVVGSVEGEARDILLESGGALVVDPEDAEGIARSIRSLHDDPTRRAELGRKGRAYVEGNYGREQLGRDYLEILGAMLDGGHSHA